MSKKVASFVLLIMFALGAVAGFFVLKHIARNDQFVLNGDKKIALTVGDTYTELGAKCVSYGKDISENVKIEGEVDTSTEGVYRIVYTIKDFKFGKIRRVRIVTVSAEVTVWEKYQP